MTTYEDLLDEEKRRIDAFRDYEKDATAVLREVLNEVRAQTGWPEESLTPIDDPNPLPEHIGKGLHGGWFDAKARYTRRISMKLANVTLERNMRVFRHDYEWYVGLGDREALQITRKNKESIEPIAEMFVSAARASFDLFYPEK